MKRIYTVTYRPHNWKSDEAVLSIVASSVLRATEAASKVCRRKGYAGAEIVRVERGIEIDKVA